MNTQNNNINQSAIYNIIKNSISKNEIIWVKYITHNSDSDSNSDIIKYIITSDKNRTIYFLYEYSIKDNKYIKTNHQSNDPTKLEQKYIKLNSKSNSNSTHSSKPKSKSDSNINTNTDIATNTATNNSINTNINTLNVINTGTNTSTNTVTGIRKRGRPKKEIQDTNTLNTKVNNKTPDINSIKFNINKNQNQNQIQNKKKGKLF